MHHDVNELAKLIAGALDLAAEISDHMLPGLDSHHPDLEEELDVLRTAFAEGDLFDAASAQLLDHVIARLSEDHAPAPVEIVSVSSGEFDRCDAVIDSNRESVRRTGEALHALCRLRALLARVDRLRRARQLAQAFMSPG